eukprot:TRINITY_DN1308_c0_g1_i2.p1 TRINITY_DN1308_c0_g1~~TRINITY_DN1308_c0_g1_i2.p1  ORF type:complete len:108 (-),score=23.05 TRINITY_DN1308_c0_g1_i2:8-331(-)
MKLIKRNSNITSKEDLGGLRAILTWNWAESKPKGQRSKVITIDKFNAATKMFGPFFLPENKNILSEMSTWVTKKWFHGDIDLDYAHARLVQLKKSNQTKRIMLKYIS